jgi:hypothetical protein
MWAFSETSFFAPFGCKNPGHFLAASIKPSPMRETATYTANWIEPWILTEKRNVRGHSASVLLKRFAKTVS